MKRVLQAVWLVALASVTPAVLALHAASPVSDQAPGQVPPAGGAGANAQAPKGTGFILGQVVDGSSGKPIPDAIVTLAIRAVAAAGRAGGGGASAPAGPLRQMTDAEGHFLFHDLVKGNYPISVTATGYVGGNSGQMRPTGPSRPVELGDGERLIDVKVRMWKYAVVTGTVVDEAGDPAVGVAVRMLRRSMAHGKPRYQLGASAKTDDRGMYRIATIVPGDFLVALPQSQVTMPVSTMDSFIKGIAGGTPAGGAIMDIMSSGGSIGTGTGVRVGDLMLSTSSGVPPNVVAGGKIFAYPTLLYPSVSTTAQATPITLGSGEERSGVDFQLKLVPTSRVSGSVLGPNGPMPNVAVRLVPVGSDDLVSDSGLDAATTSTASDGTFTFLGVPLGQYTAKVVKAPRPALPPELASSPLMQFAFGDAANAAGQPLQTVFADVPVSVGTTDVTDVAIVLTEGTKASGRLEFDGALPRPTPQQLQAVNITMTEADSHVAPGKSPGKVDAEGHFKVSGLSPGRYSVDTAGALPGWVMQSAVVAGRDVTLDSFEVKDQDVTDIVVTFSDKHAQFSGIVRGVEDKPTSVVTVLLFPVDFRTWIAGGMNVRGTRTVTASKTGAFTLPGNAFPGEYFVAALDDAELAKNDQDLGFFEALSRVATRVTIDPGDKKTQDLQIVKVVR